MINELEVKRIDSVLSTYVDSEGNVDYLALTMTDDVVISNCVINLAPDKRQVFKEAFRVLKPGGRLMVSDIVLLKELPEGIKNSIEAYIGCLSGAIMKDEYLDAITNAGFMDVRILGETHYPVEMADDPTVKAIIEYFNIQIELIKELAGSIVSIKVHGKKSKTQIINLS